MSKLTLRQFTDVVKALMEASLTKEYGIRLEIMEEPDEISDDGVKMTLKVEKESIKECTKSGKMCETYSCDCNSNFSIWMRTITFTKSAWTKGKNLNLIY